MTAPPGRPAMPKALGRYEIHSEIGRGSMGVVYKAEDSVLGRQVALKVVRAAFPAGDDERGVLEKRFLREATLAASLSHPNIVVVHDVGWDPEEGTPFIALEYLEGWTLAAAIAPGEGMDWRVALRTTARLAEALHHAHSHGVVHRDIKPSNIMILPSGQAKILDFGVAKGSNAHHTTPGELWGTPYYMSPEQASGRGVDGRSDLFSLGSVLYELVTGRRAFGGPGVAQVIHRLLHEEPPPPSRINAGLPKGMDAVLARALAKDVDKRYPDGRTFAFDIEDLLQARPHRDRGLAQPSATDTVACEPLVPPDPSPPTLTTRWQPLAGWQRFSRRVARTLSATLGAALAAGAVAIALGASMGTVETSSVAATPRVAAPVIAPAPAVLPAPPTPARARIAIALEHGLEQGRVRVWVDEQKVLDEPLAAAAETRSLLLFKKRKAVFTEVLEVAPGERSLRFEVDADGQKRSARLGGRLRRGQTRLLAVKVGGSLSLAWKS